jgi:L-rhamnose mutarotase
MKRVAAVIGLPADGAAEYERLHAEVWPDVLDRIGLSNIRNYTIFRYGELLFSYYEYVGDDLEADLAAMAADPATQAWWALCEPLQRPVPERADGEWWHVLPEVFHTPEGTGQDERSDAYSQNLDKFPQDRPLTPDTSDV